MAGQVVVDIMVVVARDAAAGEVAAAVAGEEEVEEVGAVAEEDRSGT